MTVILFTFDRVTSFNWTISSSFIFISTVTQAFIYASTISDSEAVLFIFFKILNLMCTGIFIKFIWFDRGTFGKGFFPRR